jgi:hypothetical protein
VDAPFLLERPFSQFIAQSCPNVPDRALHIGGKGGSDIHAPSTERCRDIGLSECCSVAPWRSCPLWCSPLSSALPPGRGPRASTTIPWRTANMIPMSSPTRRRRQTSRSRSMPSRPIASGIRSSPASSAWTGCWTTLRRSSRPRQPSCATARRATCVREDIRPESY